MSFVERALASRSGSEQRVISGAPWRPWESPWWRFNIGGPVHPTRAAFGADKALGLPALYASVRLLADSLASLPVKIYTGAGPAPQRYTGPTIFDLPSAVGTKYDWLFVCMTSLLLHGNAWGLITGRDGYGYPTGIEWIPPDYVNVVDDEMQPWNPLRARIYVSGRLMSRDELFHVRAFALAGRTEGISPMRAFAMTILNGLEAQQYGTDWYSNGGFPTGTFQNLECEVDREQANEIRGMLVDALRTRTPLVFGRDWSFKEISVPPSEAQFIDAIRMNASQVAAVYGLPAERVGGSRGDSMNYANSQDSALQIIEALRPWLVRLETAFADLLPANRYVRFDTDALLKTDLKTRTGIYQIQRSIGVRTVDELRALEDLPPMPGNVGNEAIPLSVMMALARSARAIPKSMIGQLDLEMDLAADRLARLQAEGMDVPSPGEYLGKLVAATRSAADEADEASYNPEDDMPVVQEDDEDEGEDGHAAR